VTRCKSCGKPVCGCSNPEYQGVVADLARVKALFQQRAVCAVMGINPESPHPISPTDDRMNSGGAASNRPASFVSGRR
jgi:hypothetical protein